MCLLLPLCCLTLFAMNNVEANASPNDTNETNNLTLDDLRFTPRQKQQMRTRMFAKYNNKWTNGIIPYVIEPVIQNDAIRLKAIQDSINIYNTKTCTRWVKRTNERNYVRFMDGGYGRCYSYLGMVSSAQDISIGGGCGTVGTVLHEMMHCLGYAHEHQRPDRDQYITIKTENIESKYLYAYDKMSPDQVDLQGLKYDYDSVMHYDRIGFGIDGRTTIITKDASKQYSIGMSNVFSKCDLEKINKMYQCTNLLTNDPSCKSSSQGNQECTEPTSCSRITSKNCMDWPGYYMPICKKTCGDCDGKKCIDSTRPDLQSAYCRNSQILCRTSYAKQIACPKLCGICKS